MIAYNFDSDVYGGDYVVIADSVSEAMAEVAKHYSELGDVTISKVTVTRLNGKVHLAPSVTAQLEVEALTR